MPKVKWLTTDGAQPRLESWAPTLLDQRSVDDTQARVSHVPTTCLPTITPGK